MNWFRRVMNGRYGTDQLTWGLLVVCLCLMFLSRIKYLGGISWLAFAVLAFCYFRIFSHDFNRRYAENQKFIKLIGPMRTKFSGVIASVRDGKTHCFFRCPSCRQKVRVPRGRGTIRITCPKCKQEFTQKT